MLKVVFLFFGKCGLTFTVKTDIISIKGARMMKIDTIRSENNRVTHEYVTPNPPHMHYEWELTLFEEGVARNVVNGVSYDVSRGDVFLMGPQDLHAIEFVTRPLISSVRPSNDKVPCSFPFSIFAFSSPVFLPRGVFKIIL